MFSALYSFVKDLFWTPSPKIETVDVHHLPPIKVTKKDVVIEPALPPKFEEEEIVEVIPVDHYPAVIKTESIDKFAFNTDGSGPNFAWMSNTHLNETASGIHNGGEILGYTIPLDRSLKRYKYKTPELYTAAIVTFEITGQRIKLLCVGNDTGGRWASNSRYDRDWGEFGINVFAHLRNRGFAVDYRKNYLSMPKHSVAYYEFLDSKIYNVEQYRQLKKTLTLQGRL